jgi:hypothetical protein
LTFTLGLGFTPNAAKFLAAATPLRFVAASFSIEGIGKVVLTKGRIL